MIELNFNLSITYSGTNLLFIDKMYNLVICYTKSRNAHFAHIKKLSDSILVILNETKHGMKTIYNLTEVYT